MTNTDGRQNSIREWVAIGISLLNLVAVIYVAIQNNNQQIALEKFKQNLSSAHLGFEYVQSWGGVRVINIGQVPANNIVLTISLPVDAALYDVSLPFTDIKINRQDYQTYSSYQITAVKLLPGQRIALDTYKVNDVHQDISQSDIGGFVTCDNCTEAVDFGDAQIK